MTGPSPGRAPRRWAPISRSPQHPDSASCTCAANQPCLVQTLPNSPLVSPTRAAGYKGPLGPSDALAHPPHGALPGRAGVVESRHDRGRDEIRRRLVRAPRVRPRRGAALRRAQRVPELEQLGPGGDVTQIGEELALLFLHMMTDALDHHGDLGVEALIVRAEVFKLPEQPLDDVVLFDRLEHVALAALDVLAGPRVEHLLFDHRVLRQLDDDLVDDRALLLLRAVAGLLESLEQLLHRLVVGLQHRDGVGTRLRAVATGGARTGSLLPG